MVDNDLRKIQLSVFTVKPPKTKVFWVSERGSLPGLCWTWHFFRNAGDSSSIPQNPLMLRTSVLHRKRTSGSKHCSVLCLLHWGGPHSSERKMNAWKVSTIPAWEMTWGKKTLPGRDGWASWAPEANDLVSTSKCHLEKKFFLNEQLFHWAGIDLQENVHLGNLDILIYACIYYSLLKVSAFADLSISVYF